MVSVRELAKQKEIELEAGEYSSSNPAEQIIHMADKMQASVIVMGKRSHTILHRWMIGCKLESRSSLFCGTLTVRS